VLAQAIDLLRRVVGGFFCYPAMERDPWLDRLRKKPEFTDLMRQAEARHGKAMSAFGRLNGSAILDVALPA